MTEPLRLAGYIRVSTRGQAEDDRFGVLVQQDQIIKWTGRSGHQIAFWFQDVISGDLDHLRERKQLADALVLLTSGQIDGIVVACADRLARDPLTQELILRDVRKANGVVFSAAEGEADLFLDDGDRTHKMLRTILAAVAEYEKATITWRMRQGREKKKAAGGYAGGAPGWGFRSVDGRLEVDPRWAPVLAEARLLLYRHHLPLREVCDFFQVSGCVKPNRGDTHWDPAQISRMVRAVSGPEWLGDKFDPKFFNATKAAMIDAIDTGGLSEVGKQFVRLFEGAQAS